MKTKLVPETKPETMTAAPVQETEQTTNLAKQDESTTALTTSEMDFEEDAGAFSSGFVSSDFAMPFIQILQSGSPQVKEENPKYIEGAKAGMILNTASNEVIDPRVAGREVEGISRAPLLFIPVTYRKTFIEWRTREAGGGFVKDHGAVEGERLIKLCIKDEKGKMIMPNTNGENQLVETAQYVVLQMDSSGAWNPAMLTFTSTQLKKSRLLNTAIANRKIPGKNGLFTPPIFYNVFADNTVAEKNDQGEWYGHKIERYTDTIELANGKDIYVQARQLRSTIDTGGIDLSKAAEAERAVTGDEAVGTSSGYEADGHHDKF